MSIDIEGLNIMYQPRHKADALEFIDALRTKYLTLQAEHEALRSSHAARAESLRVMQQRIDQLQAECQRLADNAMSLQRADREIKSRAALLLECKRLCLQGVPAFVQGNFVMHRQTRAVLAQLVV